MKGINFPLSVFIQITLFKENITTCALIDTGSEITIFKTFLIKEWKTDSNIRIKGITGQSQAINKVSKDVEIILGSKIVLIKQVYEYNSLEADILLGNDFLEQFQFYTQNVYMVTLKTSCGHLLKIPRVNRPFRVQPAERGGRQVFEKIPIQINTISIKRINLESIKKKLEENYNNNPLAFWKESHPKAKIELTENVIIKEKPMLYTIEERQEFKKQTDELLDKKLIRKSFSPFSSPAFMVMNEAEKKRNKARMVINYKRLNYFTKTDSYPLPNKEIIINLVKNKSFYSKFDCTSGFWQIKMEEDSIQYTAFSAPQGHYEWLVMPFGLKNAPSIYQRKMDNIFSKYHNFMIVYIDDILISSDTEEDHRKHLLLFAKICKENGIALSERKAIIEKKEIEFLGLKLSAAGIKLQPHISRKILEFPDKLDNRKQIERFLGCLNYAEGFIPELAKKKHEIQKLLRKNNTKGWNSGHTDIVISLKEECKTLPELRLPEDKDNLIVQTDASDLYWSAILKTDLNEICRYTSGTFSQEEVNYTTHEKELLAIKRGIEKFSLFLLQKPFEVHTDNTQIQSMIQNKLPNKPQYRRLHRWQVFLSHYNFKIKHIKGMDNFLADFLSRNVEFGLD